MSKTPRTDGLAAQPISMHAMRYAMENLARQLEAALADLRAEIKEWVCEQCNHAYPGPPQPGCMCLICPRCGGSTMPRHMFDKKQSVAALTDRVTDYILEASDDLMGGVDDPIGFLIASHRALRMELKNQGEGVNGKRE